MLRRRISRALTGTPFGVLVSLLLVMWTIEIADTLAFDGWFQSGGIHPRKLDGLDGIAWAPMLHGGWGHITSNSIPWLVLGGLVAIRGWRHWLTVTAISVIVGGFGTWLLAGGSNHIGASGVIFGYFGALLGAAFFERKPATVGPAFVVIMMYSSMLIGLVPQEGISWEGHLFGMLAGIFAASTVAVPRDRPAYVPEPWEADEPWLQSE